MTKEFTKQEIISEINRLAPFHHRIALPHGLNTCDPNLSHKKIQYNRLNSLVKRAFPLLLEIYGGTLKGKRILDVACNCGGFSIEAAKLGADYVLGIDIVEHYIKQANFIKSVLNFNQIDFKCMDMNDMTPSTMGKFDITFCFGILYHMDNPILSMQRLSSVTKHIMLVDTSIMHKKSFFKQKPMWLMKFPSEYNSNTKTSTTAHWRESKKVAQLKPNETAVVELLRFLGFSTITKVKPKFTDLERRYLSGSRVTYLAIR